MAPSFGLLKISLLLALIPANPDVVKTFFSLIYYIQRHDSLFTFFIKWFAGSE